MFCALKSFLCTKIGKISLYYYIVGMFLDSQMFLFKRFMQVVSYLR